MFILYAIPIGLVAGFLRGGSLARLGEIRFRLAPLALLVLAIQVALFSPLADSLAEHVGRAIYVVSTGLVVLVVLANGRLTGLPLIILGAASNLVAIVANGGAMPASPAALAAVGLGIGAHTNSVVVDQPVLQPLTDIFATPASLPLTNVFSIGDVLIGLGVVVALAAGMGSRVAGLGPDEVRQPPA
ncbi:MAG: hypothetical protein NVS9B8_02640 [Candidatus Limnocylindrales bacterium]